MFYGVNIEYASVGSQAGLNRIASGATDFAATDSPLTTSTARPARAAVRSHGR